MGFKLDINKKLYDAVVKSITDNFDDTVDDIFKDSQSLVPIDTGDLRRSAKKDVDNNTDGTTWEVSYNKDYAIFVELGTKYQSAQPYLYPAYFENVQKLKQKYNIK